MTVAPAAPDLVASNFAAPATVNALESFTATWTVTNFGQVATPNSWTDRVYISPDAEMFNGNDTEVGSFSHQAALGAGESRNASDMSALIQPTTVLAAGDYFLIVVANAGEQFRERGAYPAGNILVRPIQVTRNFPDLVAQNMVAPAEIEPGVPFTVSWTTKNIGTRPAGTETSTYIFFSFDTTVGNEDDIYLNGRIAPALAVNATHNDSITATIPGLPIRPSSDSLVYIKVDGNNQIYEGEANETGETNNTTTKAARFEYRIPDLQVQSVTAPNAETDTPFALSWTIRNAGNRRAGNFTDKVYFSLDNQIGNDVEIGSFALNGFVEPNQSVNRTQNVTIPGNAIPATGNYFVYVKTDANEQIDEGARMKRTT